MTSELPIVGLVAEHAADFEFYRKCLPEQTAIHLEGYESLEQLKMQCYGQLYAGFIIDIRTLVRSPKSARTFFAALLNAFPVMRVNRSPHQAGFAGFVHGLNVDVTLAGDALLNYFITEICLKTPPRGIRTEMRKTVYLSALLELPEREAPLRCTIGNISEGGAFIVCNADVHQNQQVSLVVTALTSSAPITGRVKWRKPWTPQARYLPGFGMIFTGITLDQVRELSRILE